MTIERYELPNEGESFLLFNEPILILSVTIASKRETKIEALSLLSNTRLFFNAVVGTILNSKELVSLA